jgi:hypothetical protein
MLIADGQRRKVCEQRVSRRGLGAVREASVEQRCLVLGDGQAGRYANSQRPILEIEE